MDDPVRRLPQLLTFSVVCVGDETLTVELDREGFAVGPATCGVQRVVGAPVTAGPGRDGGADPRQRPDWV